MAALLLLLLLGGAGECDYCTLTVPEGCAGQSPCRDLSDVPVIYGAYYGAMIDVYEVQAVLLWYRLISAPPSVWQSVVVLPEVRYEEIGGSGVWIERRYWRGLRICAADPFHRGLALAYAAYLPEIEAGTLLDVAVGVLSPTLGASLLPDVACDGTEVPCDTGGPPCWVRLCMPCLWTVGTPYPPTCLEGCW